MTTRPSGLRESLRKQGLKAEGLRGSLRNVGAAGPGIPDSGVARWEFEQDVTDSWGTYDGSDNTSAGYSNGIVGDYSKDCDGINDSVPVNSGNDMTEVFRDTGLSVAGWFNTESTSGRQTIWSGNGANAWYHARLNGSDIELWYASNNNSNVTASVSINTGTWYHYCGTLDPNTYDIRLYLNGSKKVTSGNGATPNKKQFSKNSIGDRAGDEYFDGLLDDVRIYKKRLSDTEVSNLYNNGQI